MHILSNNYKICTLLFIAVFLFQCKSEQKREAESLKAEGIDMAKKMADSEMIFFPKASTVDFISKGKWNYSSGLVSLAMVKLSEETNDPKYYEYVKGYADEFINEKGEIKGYNREEYNINMLNSGKFLFSLYEKTKDVKYKKAIDSLRGQLLDQPRTASGGFWYKKHFEHQMWLDGLYMEAPFYAQYAKEFNHPKLYKDVIHQFVEMQKHTYDPETGLNYHGWDESKTQKWADPKTGQSPLFWGRAMGWYAMALVDALDFIPQSYNGRDSLITIFNKVAEGIEKYQDHKTGVWYQVMDKAGKKGNYPESSASAMFIYALKKGVRNGYINKKYNAIAESAYRGFLKTFVRDNGDGTISLTKVCAVAGLGGNPYRSGSYRYYIGEPVRDNDPKGVGPFILASLEIYY